MREKHRAFIETSRAAYDRRIRRAQERGTWLSNRAELHCLVRGHNWVQISCETLGKKIRYTDQCRHCGRTRVELVREH